VPRGNCEACGAQDEMDTEGIRHLPLYVHGSEGVWLCLDCRMVLTNLVRSMIHIRAKVRFQQEKAKRA
jgi:hypothetical protein